MKIDPRIPEPVQPIIRDYLRPSEQRLIGLISRSYVIGSIALGEFNECFSDIDFITPAVHKEITSVTWWELKNHGIPIVGTASGTLPVTVNWDVLVAEMKENLNMYWRCWTRHPRRVAVLYSNWGIQWSVLGVLRQFFTFREDLITIKVKAGEYALGCLPSRWTPLIQEAINIRQGQKGFSSRFRFGRMIQTVRFLNYVIDRCNGQFVS